MKPGRLILRSGLFLGALVALDLFSIWNLDAARDRSVHAIQDAALCQHLADRIIALQSKPAIAGSAALAQDNLSRRIEAAVRGAGVAGEDLASIEPDPPVRAGDSPYLEKPTSVQLRNVSLQQLARLLCQLAADGSGLRIKSLRLTAPPEEQTGNLWSVEFTLTYLIYSPLPVPRQLAQRS
jgi:hypothetical protein